MKKDPAFLFYPKDWLQGTSQMMPEEKGVYIDLLAHQHQEGNLPSDTKRLAKMVGMSEIEFLPIWEYLKVKFSLTEDNRLVNQKLNGIVTERLTKGHTNKIAGTFAAMIRLSDLPYESKEKIKKDFRIESFSSVPEEKLTERLTEWFQERLKSIGDVNGNTYKGGAGGKKLKLDPSVRAKEINKEKRVAVFDDGFEQPLGKGQLIEIDDLKPKDIIRGLIS